MSVDHTESTLVEVFVANRLQLKRIAMNIVRNTETADDIIQDAFIRVADRGCLREISRPFCYCCQVVRNLSLDHCRGKTVEAAHRRFDVDVELVDVPCGASPDKTMANIQALSAIDRILDRVPARTRRAYELHRLDGLTQRAIATQLGCALGLVNSLIADAARSIEMCRTLMVED